MKQIELVHELIDVVGSFCQRAQVGNQADIVGLRVEFLFEHWILNDGQAMTQRECFAQDLIVWLQFSILNVFDVLENELDARVKHFDCDMLGDEMVSDWK